LDPVPSSILPLLKGRPGCGVISGLLNQFISNSEGNNLMENVLRVGTKFVSSFSLGGGGRIKSRARACGILLVYHRAVGRPIYKINQCCLRVLATPPVLVTAAPPASIVRSRRETPPLADGRRAVPVPPRHRKAGNLPNP
jgi:hypothetical protein